MKKAKAETTSEEFRTFKELAGKLVAVPKKEVEKQMAKHEHEKVKRPAHK